MLRTTEDWKTVLGGEMPREAAQRILRDIPHYRRVADTNAKISTNSPTRWRPSRRSEARQVKNRFKSEMGPVAEVGSHLRTYLHVKMSLI